MAHRVGEAGSMSLGPGDARMGARSWIGSWPVYRQLAGHDRLSLGAAGKVKRSEELEPRVRRAGQGAKSVCPYGAEGCAQGVYVENRRVPQIGGDPPRPFG